MPNDNNVPRIANRNSRQYVEKRRVFDGSNLYARINPLNNTRLYVVYSYGSHFPLWVYDYHANIWFGNNEKFSASTSRQAAQSEPREAITWLDTSTLQSVAEYGYAKTVVAKLKIY